MKPDFAYERAAWARGARLVAGVDEVGRGPLAGPVAAAAVVFAPDCEPLAGIDDSKRLTPLKREALFARILERALAVSVSFASAPEIDRLNIRGASLLAMTRAVAGLALKADFVLVDGRDLPPLRCGGQAIISGDQLSLSIAAASIVAQVVRDRLMTRLDPVFPGYGFARHAGYPTAAHRAAILRLGPSPLHRLSFKGVAQIDS